MFKDPFTNSTKGSLAGNFLDPHNTECSKICGTPVLFGGGVRNPILKTLFSSSFSINKTLAPVLLFLLIHKLLNL